MMEDEATLFHDHSTVEGQLSLCFHRIKWKYVIPPAIFLATFTGIGLLIASITSDINANAKVNPVQLAPGNSLLGLDDPALDKAEHKASVGWTVITQPSPGVVQAEGCENGLYSFEGFDASVPVATAKHLRISYLVIDAPSLVQSLREWTSLETIVIENVWVNGNFSRVSLPKLRKFIYHQYKNGKTDQYKLPEVLKQTLFFDMSPTKSWNMEKDLLNLNMTIQVSVEGSKLLNIEPNTGEININTHNCEDYLKHWNKTRTFPLSTLSLNWCPVTQTTVQILEENGGDLNYLFLNNAVPSSTELLSKVLSPLNNLKELHIFQKFHCDWPGYQIYLNMSAVSDKLETLSITNLDLTFDGIGAASVRNLSLDLYVGDDVINNFTTIFPNLASLALFNITANRTYPILKKVLLDTRVKPELVIVTDLTRPAKSTGIPLPEIQLVEELLMKAGIPPNAPNFKLELGSDGTFAGRELTSFERNFYRFTRLAFKKIDTYADYITWDALL